MPGKRYEPDVKRAVLKLGKSGKSYPQIQERFPIPKSTLSVWFKNAGRKPDRSKQLEHLRRIRLISAAAKHTQKQARLTRAITLAGTEAAALPLHRKDVAKALLAMLYWAEGGKQDGNFKFTNTDPVLMRTYLSLLRKSYVIDESKLRVALHVHYYHRHRETLTFWSKELAIPKSQFWRIYVKKRSESKRFRKNFRGICHLHYGSSAIQRELIALGKALAVRLDK